MTKYVIAPTLAHFQSHYGEDVDAVYVRSIHDLYILPRKTPLIWLGSWWLHPDADEMLLIAKSREMTPPFQRYTDTELLDYLLAHWKISGTRGEQLTRESLCNLMEAKWPKIKSILVPELELKPARKSKKSR